METIGAIFYFASILGALPIFVALDAFALIRLRGWARLLALGAGVYIVWTVVVEFGPVLVHRHELDPSDLRRLIYERWSAAARPAMHGAAFVLALLLLRFLRREQ